MVKKGFPSLFHAAAKVRMRKVDIASLADLCRRKIQRFCISSVVRCTKCIFSQFFDARIPRKSRGERNDWKFLIRAGKSFPRLDEDGKTIQDSPSTPYCCGVSLTSPSGPPGTEEMREALSLMWLRVLASLLLAQETCDTLSTKKNTSVPKTHELIMNIWKIHEKVYQNLMIWRLAASVVCLSVAVGPKDTEDVFCALEIVLILPAK